MFNGSYYNIWIIVMLGNDLESKSTESMILCYKIKPIKSRSDVPIIVKFCTYDQS